MIRIQFSVGFSLICIVLFSPLRWRGLPTLAAQTRHSAPPEMRRLQVLQGHLAPTYWGRSPTEVAEYRKALLLCREELREFILEELCAPILVRLAWHDSGTYDACVPAIRACDRLWHAID